MTSEQMQTDTAAMLRKLLAQRNGARSILLAEHCDCGQANDDHEEHAVTCPYRAKLRAAEREAYVDLIDDDTEEDDLAVIASHERALCRDVACVSFAKPAEDEIRESVLSRPDRFETE